MYTVGQNVKWLVSDGWRLRVLWRVIPVLGSAACGPALAPMPSAAPPSPAVVPPAAAAPTVARIALPLRLNSTTWRVASTTRLKAAGGGVTGDEQRLDARALVSWSLTRTAQGALRATGQVDSFTVASTLDSAGSRPNGGGKATTKAPSGATAASLSASLGSMLLVEATIDSAMARVSVRPPLANECDRPEASAAALARELLVRIPDGVARGESWRDSSAALVCRSGVPITVYTTTVSTLETLNDERVVIARQITTRLDGKGGSAFRALELSGSGTGTQRVEVRVSDGSVSKLEGTSTLTLQLRETTPPAPPRSSQLTQRVDIKAERVSR